MDIKLRCANKGDIPKLKELWQICFGDRMRYIDIFFENMFVAEDTLIAETDEKIAGVVYILRRSLNAKIFLYGYAIGVFPEYRGNNICETMLKYIKEYSEKYGYIFGLHPANDKLAEFYQRIGLGEMYSLKVVDATDFVSSVSCEIQDITFDEFCNLRFELFQNSVDWDKKALSYIYNHGEIVKKVIIDGKSRYFVLNSFDGVLTVKETNATDEEIKSVTESLKKHFDAKKVIFILSSKSALQGVIKPMIYGFSKKNDDVYMNLFLD